MTMHADFETTRPVLDRREAPLSAPISPATLRAQAPRTGDIFLPLIAVALWVLTHNFPGIFGDANIYIGYALAKLDPAGVGRDMMFANDGQMGFSLFPALLKPLVAGLGTLAVVRLFAVLSIVCWLAALSVFARQFVAWRAISIVVIFVAIMPTFYGWPWHFSYSEITAIPRPFTEALVLAGLAALIADRTALALAALVAASLIHPLMALAGWGVLGLVLCREDARWRIAAALAAVALVIAALSGAPVIGRLLMPMAPDLKALAQGRSPLLFLRSWPVAAFYPMVIQAVTLAIAASLYNGRRQTVFVAAVVVALLGLAVQVAFGDRFSLVLVLQAQLWRMTWLMAALAAVAMALLALRLRAAPPRDHAVFAFLVMAWLGYDSTWCTIVFAGVAALLHFGFRTSTIFTWRLAAVLWGVAIVWGLCWIVTYFVGYVHFAAGLPAGGPGAFSYVFTRRYLALPICALALMLFFAPPSRLKWVGEAALAAALVGLAAWVWDSRPAFQKLIDANIHPPGLIEKLAARPGEILWINGLTESWYLAGRPQWASPQQGVSSIFSPTLARKWRERTQFLIAQGLADRHVLAMTLNLATDADLPRVTRAGLDHLCARADAPAWVVAPNWAPDAIAPDLNPVYWHPGVPSYLMTEETEGYVWHRVSGYAIFPCAKG
jgi:hypothetical protein